MDLPPDIAHLREEALQLQRTGIDDIPTLPLIDANTWAQRTPDEDWLLWRAQAHPEAYADLLVRVAGYSDYFVHLDPNMQTEIIERTEHASV